MRSSAAQTRATAEIPAPRSGAPLGSSDVAPVRETCPEALSAADDDDRRQFILPCLQVAPSVMCAGARRFGFSWDGAWVNGAEHERASLHEHLPTAVSLEVSEGTAPFVEVYRGRSTAFELGDLAAGASYRARLRRVASAGNDIVHLGVPGPYAAFACAAEPPSAPLSLAVSKLHSGSACIKWCSRTRRHLPARC